MVQGIIRYIKNLTGTKVIFPRTKTKAVTNDNNVDLDHILVPMKGATSSAAGGEGFVPAPSKGDQKKFLRADGMWIAPPSVVAVGTKSVTADKASNFALSAAENNPSVPGSLRADVDALCSNTATEFIETLSSASQLTHNGRYKVSAITKDFAKNFLDYGIGDYILEVFSNNIDSNGIQYGIIKIYTPREGGNEFLFHVWDGIVWFSSQIGGTRDSAHTSFYTTEGTNYVGLQATNPSTNIQYRLQLNASGYVGILSRSNNSAWKENINISHAVEYWSGVTSSKAINQGWTELDDRWLDIPEGQYIFFVYMLIEQNHSSNTYVKVILDEKGLGNIEPNSLNLLEKNAVTNVLANMPGTINMSVARTMITADPRKLGLYVYNHVGNITIHYEISAIRIGTA